MEVRNCKSCGALFNYVGETPLCTSCQKELDDKFYEVRNYIYEHREASMQKVAEENDVSVAQIKKWVREERLEFTEDSAIFMDCESCGAGIKTGRFCKACKDKMSHNLGNMYQTKRIEPQKKTRERERMRFLDN